MRILFMTYRYWPAVGGVEKYIHRLSQALIVMGHDVGVVTSAPSDGLPAHEWHEGVEVFRFPGHRAPLRAWWHLMRMRPVFNEADVVHVSDTFMLEYFHRMVGWTMPDKPVFLTRHGMSYVHPVPELEKRRARRSLTMADGIIHDGCFIEKWLGVEPDCVPNQGLYPTADKLPRTPEPPPTSATFVGRLEPDSGIEIYVDAIRVLQAEHGLSITLDVYGDGTLRGRLEERARSDALPIRFHGWRGDAQERILDGCFAFVAGRMAMQEAMARRRLVVAAYVDPLKKDYVNGEPFSPYLLSGPDGGSIAALVARYARDDAARRGLIERAYAHAATLSWTRTAEAYLDLWERAPRRASRRRSLWYRFRLARQFASEARTATASARAT